MIQGSSRKRLKKQQKRETRKQGGRKRGRERTERGRKRTGGREDGREREGQTGKMINKRNRKLFLLNLMFQLLKYSLCPLKNSFSLLLTFTPKFLLTQF